MMEDRQARLRKLFEDEPIGPGDLYEDCAYHPVLCMGVDYDADEIWGVSLIDGSFPQSCKGSRHRPPGYQQLRRRMFSPRRYKNANGDRLAQMALLGGLVCVGLSGAAATLVQSGNADQDAPATPLPERAAPQCEALKTLRGGVYLGGFPADLARACDPVYEPTLIGVLLDRREKDLTRSYAAFVLGFIGGQSASEALMEFILSDRIQSVTSAFSAASALGNIVHRTGNREALEFLIWGADLEHWKDGQSAWKHGRTAPRVSLQMQQYFVLSFANGLSMSGEHEAHAALERLRSTTREPSDPLSSEFLESLIQQNEKVARFGIDEIFDGTF